MKFIVLTVAALSFGIAGFSQNQANKKLPSTEMLPKEGEVKHIYELPAATNYKIYDQKGELVKEGKGQFIDYTDYKKGTYFILFDGKKHSFIKE